MLKDIKKIVVLGGGESGCGSAVLAKLKGFSVFLSDQKNLLSSYKNILDDYEIEYEQQCHTLNKIISADLVIKSPGIPDSAEIIKQLVVRGIRVISELEFAKYFTDAKIICITGSNGKTTTTTLIYNILKDYGYNVGLGGNIGKSFAMQVALCNYDWYVLEVSSFQLDGMSDFKADISILTNITPDHLDRYDYSMDNYIRSKFRVCNNQTIDDYFIYSGDDKHILSNIDVLANNVNRFSYSVNSIDNNAFLDDNVVIRVKDKELILKIEDIPIKGLHNISNVMASGLCAMLAAVDVDTIKQSIISFKGVEHRVEHICCVNDIVYINDSKATNVDAVWYALQSMTRPVIWIAGGTDKGNDYTPLLDLVKSKVHTLICLGMDNDKLINTFGDIVPAIYDTGCLEDAVSAIKDSVQSGDVVLLSPACASFDLFDNYEHRGNLFKQAINDFVNE